MVKGELFLISIFSVFYLEISCLYSDKSNTQGLPIDKFINSEIIELQDQTFDDYITANDYVLVTFTADYS